MSHVISHQLNKDLFLTFISFWHHLTKVQYLIIDLSVTSIRSLTNDSCHGLNSGTSLGLMDDVEVIERYAGGPYIDRDWRLLFKLPMNIVIALFLTIQLAWRPLLFQLRFYQLRFLLDGKCFTTNGIQWACPTYTSQEVQLYWCINLTECLSFCFNIYLCTYQFYIDRCIDLFFGVVSRNPRYHCWRHKTSSLLTRTSCFQEKL